MLWTGIYISFEGNPVLWSSHSTFLHPRFFVCETGISRSLVSREPLKVIPSTLKHWRNPKTLTFSGHELCTHNKSFDFMFLCMLLLLQWNEFFWYRKFSFVQVHASLFSKQICHLLSCLMFSSYTSIFSFYFCGFFS